MQTFAVRICPDCNAERRIHPCPLCRGEGRVAITPYPRWMSGQYPLGVYPEIVPHKTNTETPTQQEWVDAV